MTSNITEEQRQELVEYHSRSWSSGVWFAIAGGITVSFIATPIFGIAAFIWLMLDNTLDSVKRFNKDVRHQELLNK